MTQPSFGDLRALMNAPYSRQVWEQLCDWVHAWDPQDYQDTVRPYLEGHLHDWHDVRRFLPRRWQARFMEGKPVQGMELVRSVDLSGWTKGPSMRWKEHTFPATLFSSPQWSFITRLDLRDNVLDETLITQMATCSHLGNLKAIDLAQLEFHECDADTLIGGLLDAAWLSGIEELDLSRIEVDPSRLFYMEMPALRSLVLRRTSSLQSIRMISKRWPGTPLRRLDLSETKDPVYQQIGELEPFDELEELVLDKNAFYASSMERLATLPLASSLRRLNLWSCGLDDKKFRTLLAHWPRVSSLRVLNIAYNEELSRDSIEALLAHPVCEQLDRLDLFGCRLGDEALSMIIDSGLFSAGAHVNLMQNQASKVLREGIAKQPELSDIFRV